MTQATALNILKTGTSVFLTGSAGSGKTYVLNEYIKFLRDAGVPVAITASTGIASTHLGGQTIHSWSGLGIIDELSERDLDALEHKQHLWKRFGDAKVLIIDEVSMLHAHRLDMVDKVLRHFRKIDRPFGGVQIILSGDFFQLPPVTRGAEVEDHDFIFSARSWKQLDPVVCYLTEQYRQDDDTLTKILNEIRNGELSSTSHGLLRERLEVLHSIPHTKLYTHNVDVDAINTRELQVLDTASQIYQMESHGRGALVLALVKSCLAPEVLELRIGAKVMFVKNDPERKYVNGTLGVVEAFYGGFPNVRTNDGRLITVSSATWAIEEDGKVKASIDQLPLRLAWAITIHKSQGMSLDAAEIDLSKAFTYGQGYVALSRLRTLDGVALRGFHPESFSIHPTVRSYDETLHIKSENAEEAFERMGLDEIQVLQKKFVEHVGGMWPDGTLRKKGVVSNAKQDTYMTTYALLLEQKSLDEIANLRNLTVGTILSHLEILKKRDELPDITYLEKDEGRLQIITDTFKQLKTTQLTPVFEYLKKADFDVSYDELRLARVFLDEIV